MATNPTYNCYYCDYSSKNQHLIPHLLNNHKEELGKVDHINCKTAAIHGKPILLPIKHEKQKLKVECCLGCKTFYINHTKALNHIAKCPNKAKHKELCASLLPTVENTVEDSSEAVQQLKNEIVKLKRLLERKDEEIKEYERLQSGITVLQQVIYEMPQDEQEIMAERCIKVEKQKEQEIENWEPVEWEAWFSEELLDTVRD